MLNFSTLWKGQKTSGFLTFSGDIEMEHWLKMSEIILMFIFVKKQLKPEDATQTSRHCENIIYH